MNKKKCFPLVLILAFSLISLNAEDKTKNHLSLQPKESQSEMSAGYNETARVKFKNSDGLTVAFLGNFTYWQAMQENMELGSITDTASSLDSVNAQIVNMNFDFQPGFQMGVGFSFAPDNWDIFFGYTWFRGTNFKKTILDPDDTLITLLPAWQIPTLSNPSYFLGKEKWTLHMDLIDSLLGRIFYVGKRLTIRPYIGMRVPLIRQKIKVTYDNNINNSFQTTETTEMFNSWGIGPRGGFDLNWLLGKGFSIYGKTGLDISYTEYTKYRYNQESIVIGEVQSGSRYKYAQSDLGYLRTHIDTNLGINWGSYCLCNSCYFLFAADYCFQVFFNQNMFRNYVDDQGLGKNVSPNGNLYIQGLTLTLGLDF